MKKAINGTTITFSFDGGLDPIVFDATKAAAPLRAYAEMHGWQARLGDMAAIPRTQKDGTVITVTEQMRRDAVLAGVEHVESGTAAWEMKSAPRAAPEAPAIRRLADAKFEGDYTKAMAHVAEMALAELTAE